MSVPAHNPLSVVLGEVERVIEALDGTPYATSSIAAPTWRHAKQSITSTDVAALGSALDQHLMFSTSIESAPATGVADPDFFQIEADMVVAFLFKSGAGEKIEKERLAMGAARDIADAILGEWPYGQANAEIKQFFSPGAMIGDFLPVEMRFAILVDIPYGRP